ncbi:MAG: glycoside hydrolase family 88 protein, partial [Bacteroidales bacterium]|nr:glycoside hydrolase family 88 protein [Bacteroidales bacterium]
GSSLGAGSLAMVEGDSLYRLGSTPVYRYVKIADGPVRTLFELRYKGWEVNGQQYEAIERITLWVGKYWFQSAVTVKDFSGEKQLATGIVTSKLDNEPVQFQANDNYTTLLTHGKQSLNNDILAMAVMAPTKDFVKTGKTSNNDYYKLGYPTVPAKSFSQVISETCYLSQKIRSNTPSVHYFFALWGLENPVWNQQEPVKEYIRSEADRLSRPVSIEYGKNEKIFKKKIIKERMATAVRWQLAHPKHELNDWTNGAFYAGVMAAYETLGSKEIYRALTNMGDSTGWKPGNRLHHADDHAICQTYIDLYRIEKDRKMIQPTIDTFDKMMATPYQPRSYQKIYRWWCDALFMGPPALVKLGMTLGDQRYIDFSDKLFRETVDLLWNEEESLFARDLNYVWGYSEKDLKEANGQKVFWSRGNGWVMGGLVRILKELPHDYAHRGDYVDLYQKMAKRISSLQMPDGLWRASLLDPSSYPGGEASGSGFYCYALAWGINNGLLEKSVYLPVVEKAWAGLNSLLTDDGYVGWVQPIGADPQKNFSPTSWEVYGTGAFLLAGSEVIKLKR